ncbi:hypothetical protein GCM10029964_012550 [Kibdelosporangium lantanae]
MSFVRYDDYRAPERPDFQAELDTIIAAIVQRTKESPRHEPGGRAVRSAHAKTYGLLRASVTVLPDLPAEYAQGVYATPPRTRPSSATPTASATSVRTRTWDPRAAWGSR